MTHIVGITLEEVKTEYREANTELKTLGAQMDRLKKEIEGRHETIAKLNNQGMILVGKTQVLKKFLTSTACDIPALEREVDEQMAKDALPPSQIDVLKEVSNQASIKAAEKP